MYYNSETILFFDGKFVKAADASIDLYSQTMHYGLGVFEGIRAYTNHLGEASIFKAKAHFDRLHFSASTLNLPLPFSTETLIKHTYDVLAQNNLTDAYIRPLVFAPANMSFAVNTHSHLMIAAWPMQPFLGEKLLRVMISSFQRPNPKGFFINAKACGHYVNSILASQEAKAQGFDEALMLDMDDHIAEAPGANVFVEKNGTLFTPAIGHILPGITRATVINLAEEMGVKVIEKIITKEDMLQADSAFFCGTAAEVIGIQSVNDYHFPLAWQQSLGAALQQQYKHLVTHQPTGEFLTA